MAVTIDWPTGVITVNQADLTLVTGTLYELDTNQFRKDLNALQASAQGMPWPTTHLHNTQVTVAGVIIARTVEIISPYSVQFLPDSAWTVRLVGSNNNIFDVQNGILIQNQVQVIPGNSAGLIVAETGVSGLTPTESTQLSTAATTLPGIETDIGAIETSVTGIGADIGTIQTDVAAVNASIVSIDGNIATIQTDVGFIQVDQAFMYKVVRNRKITNPATGMLTIMEDNNVDVWMECEIWDDATMTVPYKSEGLEAQWRLEPPP